MFKTINKSSTLYILAVVIFFLKISTFEEIFYTYGDDSWVLVGSNYTDVFDKVICCAFSQLGFSLFFQNLFLLAPSTDIYIKLLFFLFCFTSVIVVNYTNLNFNFYEKLIFLMLLYNSPMLMNYSLRSKPFVFESLITLFILGLLLKSNSINNIENKILVYFSIFIFFSLVTIIPITAFFFILLRKKILKLNKNLFSYIPFSIFVAIISFLSFLKKNSEIDLGWISYYAPSEGGIGLFFRWLYFSVIRIFTESNKLDLGASGFSTFVSVSLFLLGVYYLVFIKRNYLAFEFGLYKEVETSASFYMIPRLQLNITNEKNIHDSLNETNRTESFSLSSNYFEIALPFILNVTSAGQPFIEPSIANKYGSTHLGLKFGFLF